VEYLSTAEYPRQLYARKTSMTNTRNYNAHAGMGKARAGTKGTRRQGHGARKQGKDTRTQRALSGTAICEKFSVELAREIPNKTLKRSKNK